MKAEDFQEEMLSFKDIESFLNEMEASRELSWKNFGKRIYFYVPSFIHYNNPYYSNRLTIFPSISLTGDFCAMKCKHCSGKILKTMIPVKTPDELLTLCETLKKESCAGCLISGGCLANGSIPFDRYIDVIARIKKEFNKLIVVHTGLISFETARKLKKAGVEVALFDVIGSNQTIREVMQLDVTVEDYRRSLENINKAGLALVPHIIVGLQFGRLKGEIKALEMISRYDPAAVVLIALMPLKGTPMEKVKPPTPEDIARMLILARLALPVTPLALGCMRPLGAHRVKTDVFAVMAGINGIAFPSKEAIALAKSLGLQTKFSQVCCSQICELKSFANL